MEQFSISTGASEAMIDITGQISALVRTSGALKGICTVFIPHTTCGITINENADPSVKQDILSELRKIVPPSDEYTHSEGNSDAHIKACMIGSSVSVIIDEGSLVLGTWQGIYLCEFDGPRTRRVFVQILTENK